MAVGMDNLPEFLVIGVQKAATSWLWYCLEEHPDIFLPKKREENYLGGEKYREEGWDWWVSRFAKAQRNQLVGEVSVDYIFSREAPGLIRKRLDPPKFIVLLRDPIERAISAYFWNLRKAKIPDLELNEGLSYALAYAQEGATSEQETVYSNIIRRGFYDEQISRYFDHFGADRFLFLSFQQIKQEPLKVLQSVCRFLMVDPGFKPKALTRQPKRNSFLKLLIELERIGYYSKPVSVFIDRLNALVCRLGMGGKRPQLTADLEKKLISTYAEHNQNLVNILADRGVTFSQKSNEPSLIYWTNG